VQSIEGSIVIYNKRKIICLASPGIANSS